MKSIFLSVCICVLCLSGCGWFIRDEVQVARTIPTPEPVATRFVLQQGTQFLEFPFADLEESTVTIRAKYRDAAGDLVEIFYSAQKAQSGQQMSGRALEQPTQSTCQAGPEVKRWLSYLGYFEPADYTLCQAIDDRLGNVYTAEARFDERTVILVEPTVSGLMSEREEFFLSYGFSVVKLNEFDLHQAIRQASKNIASDWEVKLQQALEG